MHEWRNLEELDDEFTPGSLEGTLEQAQKAGHGGGDLIEMVDFVDAVTGKRPPEIGIHEAMDMTLPGLVSQQSIAQDGAWLAVPDSREW